MLRARRGLPRPTDRVGVDVDNHPIDEFGDAVVGQGVPGRRRLGELSVQDRHDVGVGDQRGPIEDDPKHPQIHHTGAKRIGEAR